MKLELVKRIPKAKVAVVGDIMVDVYLHGEVSRISPEAPVPVVRWTSERATVGGAANVAASIVFWARSPRWSASSATTAASINYENF